MNFVAANFVYHCSPEVAFCLFTKLMRLTSPNYDNELSGLRAKQLVLEEKLESLPSICTHFQSLGVMTSMYSTEMIMSLMGCNLNLKQLASFYDKFLLYRWDYFYKVVLKALDLKKEDILKC